MLEAIRKIGQTDKVSTTGQMEITIKAAFWTAYATERDILRKEKQEFSIEENTKMTKSVVSGR